MVKAKSIMGADRGMKNKEENFETHASMIRY